MKAVLDPRNRYDLHEFHVGMNVELEHHDITCGDPIQTGKIVMAHMPETEHYYPKLIRHVEGKPWLRRASRAAVEVTGRADR